MAISLEAKVGAATIAALLAIGAGFAWLGHFSLLGHGYGLDVAYKDVSGLENGANVMYMGVKVGHVAAVTPQGSYVHVAVQIDRPDVAIPQGSHFKIFSKGIIGEKELDVFPPSPMPATPVPLQNGEQVRGDDPPRFELAVEQLTKSLQRFQKSANPEKLQAILNQTGQNLLDTTSSIKRLSARSEGLLDQAGLTLANLNDLIGRVNADVGAASPTDVREIVQSLKTLTAGLSNTYTGIFGATRGNGKHPQNAQVVRNIRAIAAHLDQLTAGLSETAGSPEVQSDLKGLLKNLKVLSSSLSAATQLSQPARAAFAVSPRIEGELVSHGQGAYLAGNLSVRGNLLDNFYDVGIEQIGEGPYFDLDIGHENQWGPAGYEVGLIRSKLGAGLDYELNKSLTLDGQVYDPADLTFRVGTTYFPLSSAYGFHGQWARTFQTGDNTFWLGIEWRPLDAQPSPAPRPAAP